MGSAVEPAGGGWAERSPGCGDLLGASPGNRVGKCKEPSERRVIDTWDSDSAGLSVTLRSEGSGDIGDLTPRAHPPCFVLRTSPGGSESPWATFRSPSSGGLVGEWDLPASGSLSDASETDTFVTAWQLGVGNGQLATANGNRQSQENYSCLFGGGVSRFAWLGG